MELEDKLLAIFIIAVFLIQPPCHFGEEANYKKGIGVKRENIKAISDAEKIWKQIAKAGGSPPRKKDPKTVLDYWVSVMEDAERHFTRITLSRNQRVKMEYFVSRFGKNGSSADMRWLLSSLCSTFNCGGNGGIYKNNTPNGRRKRHSQLLLAEIHAKELFNHPKTLRRYYHAVLWLDHFFSNEKFVVFVSDTRRGMNKYSPKNPEYWWYSRNVLLLIHSTNRHDLLNKHSPEQLGSVFKKWLKWFEQDKNGAYLVPDIKTYTWKMDKTKGIYTPFVKKYELRPFSSLPKHPFPDWEDYPSISARALRDLM